MPAWLLNGPNPASMHRPRRGVQDFVLLKMNVTDGLFSSGTNMGARRRNLALVPRSVHSAAVSEGKWPPTEQHPSRLVSSSTMRYGLGSRRASTMLTMPVCQI